MKSILITVIAVSLPLLLFGQTRVSGQIKDAKGGTIVGANIFIVGSYDGSSSDAQGSFSFSTSETGLKILKVSFIGYKSYETEISLEGGVVDGFDIVIEEAINKMNAVVITAGSFNVGSENKSEVLRPLDIVTTAGATADIPGALNTLPGTQTVGEEGRLFVRGGDGYETTTFIDGMIVLDSYDPTIPNVATRSRFSPMMFKGVSFSTGGYSAEYGQGLSSALILNSKDQAFENRTDFSFITVGLEASHTQVWENSSISAKVGYFNLDPYFKLVPQDLNWLDAPTSFDGNLAYRHKIGKNGLFKSYIKYNSSEMLIDYDPIDFGLENIRTKIHNNYTYLNGTYKDLIKDKWVLNTGLSFTNSDEDIHLDNDLVNEKDQGWHWKTTLGRDLGGHFFLKFGGEVIDRMHIQHFRDYETDFENHFEFEETMVSAFIESDIFLSNSLVVRAGVRTEYNSLNGDLSFDPRLSLAAQTGEYSQVSVAYGIFRQSPEKDFLRVNSILYSEKAEHFIVNYQLMKSNRTFRVEAYWKNYSDLIKYDINNRYDPSSYSNQGEGYARGLDLFYRDNRTIKNADFWLSYSFLDSERDYKYYPNSAAPSFTSKHNFSAVYKHFITSIRSQIGFTWSMTSGRPFNDPNQDDFNGQRTPVYRDLSTNISYLMRKNIIIYVSVSNLTGRENIYGYEFSSIPNEMGLYEGRAIVSPAPRFLLIGFFLTLTKSGTMNQLPNL